MNKQANKDIKRGECGRAKGFRKFLFIKIKACTSSGFAFGKFWRQIELSFLQIHRMPYGNAPGSWHNENENTHKQQNRTEL
jgi:hypothetical protein